jgi:hypothetical protein
MSPGRTTLNLPLAVAQQLVADSVAVLYERELAIFEAVDNEIAPPRDGYFTIDDGVQATQIAMCQIDMLQQPGDERVLLQGFEIRGSVHGPPETRAALLH